MMEKPWTITQAGEFLERTEGAIRKLVLKGKIPYRKAGGRIYFLPSELYEWLENSPGVRLENVK
jgi:hypothetical protein